MKSLAWTSSLRSAAGIALLVAFLSTSPDLRAQVPAPSASQIVHRMVLAESAAWKHRQHFLYSKEERSDRTKGHVWQELVVETSDGAMERLMSIDGKPLSKGQERLEEQRIANFVRHPQEFRRQTKRRKEEEGRMPGLLGELGEIFTFADQGKEGDCNRIAFRPNPSFQEKTYQDRVVHAMSGVMLIGRTDMRLRKLDVHLDHRVEFGFGLLGNVSDTTHFSLVRKEVVPGRWEPARVRVHLDGTVLLMKSISRDVDSLQYGFKLVPHDLTVAQAADMFRSDGELSTPAAQKRQ